MLFYPGDVCAIDCPMAFESTPRRRPCRGLVGIHHGGVAVSAACEGEEGFATLFAELERWEPKPGQYGWARLRIRIHPETQFSPMAEEFLTASKDGCRPGDARSRRHGLKLDRAGGENRACHRG